MTRNYRQVAKAEDTLRRVLGILQHPDLSKGSLAYMAIGSARVHVQAALELIAGPENTEDSPAYQRGLADVDGWKQPELPFGA